MRRFVKYMNSSTFGAVQRPPGGEAAKRPVNLPGSLRIQSVEQDV